MTSTLMLRRRGTDILYPHHPELAKHRNMEAVRVDADGKVARPPSEAEILAGEPKLTAKEKAALAKAAKAKAEADAKAQAEADAAAAAAVVVPEPAPVKTESQVNFGSLGDDVDPAPVLTGNPDLDAELTKVMKP